MLNIKTPNDILKFMDSIDYGYVDLAGEKHINNLKGFRTNYRTLDINQILEHKIGTCIEQVLLMHYLLDELNIKNKMFCCRIFEPDDYGNLEEEEHMHCFLLYYENQKVA